MNIIKYPSIETWPELVKRPHLDVSQLNDTVKRVLDDVRQQGDEAVKNYEQKFDHAVLNSLAVSEEEIDEAMTLVPTE